MLLTAPGSQTRKRTLHSCESRRRLRNVALRSSSVGTQQLLCCSARVWFWVSQAKPTNKDAHRGDSNMERGSTSAEDAIVAEPNGHGGPWRHAKAGACLWAAPSGHRRWQRFAFVAVAVREYPASPRNLGLRHTGQSRNLQVLGAFLDPPAPLPSTAMDPSAECGGGGRLPQFPLSLF